MVATVRHARRRPIFQHRAHTVALSLGRADIERLLPHRSPFLLVDALTAIDAEERAIEGLRTIDPADPILSGHFPGDPVYPGVLLVEAMAQVGLCLVKLGAPSEAASPGVRLLGIREAHFLAEVRPGDQLRLQARVVDEDPFRITLLGQALRGDAPCAVALLDAFLVEDEA